MHRPSFLKSIRHAVRGLQLTLKTERNFRIQCLVALAVFAAALAFPLSRAERLIVAFVALTVLVLELLNTAVERLIDLMKPRLSEVAGDIKDVMAGAVLLASIFAVGMGGYIFWPHFTQLLSSL